MIERWHTVILERPITIKPRFGYIFHLHYKGPRVGERVRSQKISGDRYQGRLVALLRVRDYGDGVDLTSITLQIYNLMRKKVRRTNLKYHVEPARERTVLPALQVLTPPYTPHKRLREAA